LIERESSFEIIFTQGSVFGRLSTRGDEEDAVDWANRLASRIECNPLPPPVSASVSARTRVFNSSVRPTVEPEPSDAVETSLEPIESASTDLIVEPTAEATSTAFVMLDVPLELSSTASVGLLTTLPSELLSEGFADLILSKIVPGSNPASPGANVNWTASIFNGGTAEATDRTLAVFIRQISTTTLTKVGELEFPDIPASAALDITFSRPAVKNEIIEFMILPSGSPDLRDDNNHGSVVVSDIMLPELIIESLIPASEAVYPNQWAEWVLTVTNAGAGNFYGEAKVELIGDVEGTATTTFMIGTLATGESAQLRFGSLVAEETSITARVDFTGLIDEFNETNNTLADVPGLDALRPNLIVDGVTSNPEFPEPGDNVEWTYSILNRGPGNSQSFDLTVFASMDLTTTSTVVFQASSNGLEIGETLKGSFKRIAAAEESLRFVIDNSGALEISESDNILEFATHERMLPELRIVSITSNRMNIDAGEAFTYRIDIENSGSGDVSRYADIGMFDVVTGEELSTTRVAPVTRGGSVTVSLDVDSADGQSLSFRVDSTSKVLEADEENNSVEVSVLDVMTHDINIESLTVGVPVDFVEETSFRWLIANNGPGRALDLNAHVTIFHAAGGSTALAVVVISSLESGANTTGERSTSRWLATGWW